jgi:hypothetical protein
LLNELKNIANKRDIPYQSLVKIYLARQVALERDLVGGTDKQWKNAGNEEYPSRTMAA